MSVPAPSAPRRAPRWFSALLWLALAAGVHVRCADLELMEYKRDEFYFVDMARRNAERPFSVRSLHAAAPLPHPPGTAYFLTPAVMLTDDPVQVCAFVVGVNLIALAVLYAFLRGAFCRETALWGTALLASVPWAVISARKIWNGDLIFPFTIFAYAVLFSTLRRYRPWKVHLTCVALAVMAQMHLSTWIVAPALLLFALLWRVRARPRDVAVGVGLAALVFLPYLLDLARLDPHRAGPAGGSGPDLGRGLAGALCAVTATSGLGLEGYFGEEAYDRFVREGRLGWTFAVFVAYCVAAAVATAAFAAGSAGWLRQRWRTGERSPERDVVVWFLVLFACVMAVYTVSGKRVRGHHVLNLYPMFPLLFVLGLRRVEGHGRAWAWAARSFLLLVLAANLTFLSSFYGFVEHNPLDLQKGRYGIPYSVREERWNVQRTRAWEERVRADFERRSHVQR